jgi:formiminotetrahydrofolate cyclodeaminase
MSGASGRFAELTLEEFAARLASDEPVPGGGSASAVVAALGASLVEMVARLSMGRPRYADYTATHERAAAAAADARGRFLDLADADAAAYGRLATAFKLPRDTEAAVATRDEIVSAAALGATDVPLEVVRDCRALAVEIEALAGRSNLNAASDLGVAALLVGAAAEGAAANVIVNLPSISDPSAAGEATTEVKEQLDEIQHLVRVIREIVGDGRLREPEEA